MMLNRISLKFLNFALTILQSLSEVEEDRMKEVLRYGPFSAAKNKFVMGLGPATVAYKMITAKCELPIKCYSLHP